MSDVPAATPGQVPAATVGRIVHYKTLHGYAAAAIVTATEIEAELARGIIAPIDTRLHVHLYVFDPTGPHAVDNVPHASQASLAKSRATGGFPIGTWRWPPR